MNTTKIPLSLVKVASPCTAPWDAMSGNDRTRFCGQCAQYVFNLSEMTQEEAETLIMEAEGKMCVRYYRRTDGTMMTKDCPIGWRAIKRRVALLGGVAVTMLVTSFSLLTLGVFASVRGNGNGGVRLVNPIERMRDWLFPQPQPVMGLMPPAVVAPAPPPGGNEKIEMVLGEMCPLPKNQAPLVEQGQPPPQGVPIPVVPQIEQNKA